MTVTTPGTAGVPRLHVVWGERAGGTVDAP